MTLLLFDLNPTGHHPGYLQHLIRYWDASRWDASRWNASRWDAQRGRLVVVVSADFPRRHPAITRLAANTAGVELKPISEAEQAKIAAKSSFLARMAAEWRLMVAYASRELADHVLLMYLDQFQLAMLTESGPDCPFSGILFRPTLHYARLGHPPVGWRERLREWRKNLTIHLALRHPRLRTVFSSDPYSLPVLGRFAWNVRFVHLPDPVQVYPVGEDDAAALASENRLITGRKTLLLFGHLDSRKGIRPLQKALAQLPETTRRRLTLWLVGPLEDDQRRYVEKMENLPGLEVRRHHEFVPDEEVQTYFQAADGVLALYQRHVGGSAVLVRAAAAGKPALASDYGLVGQLVRENGLGLALDATDPAAVAAAVTRFLESPPLGNPEQMRNFAELNRASEYARVIFEAIA